MTDEPTPVIEMEGITKRFGETIANDAVDLQLREQTIHAVVGENGAGKTTLMRILFGLYQPDSGRILKDGTPRTFNSPSEAIEAGIGMIHQHFQLVETLTVGQNIVLGHEPSKNGFVDWQRARGAIEEICTRYGFDLMPHLDDRVEDLGVGMKQRVEIVKSLYRGAEILILDEPTAVLTPQEAEQLFSVMTELRAEGFPLIFITHKLDEVFEVADDITVLRDGSTIDTVPATETTRQQLAQMMVGRDVLFEFETRTPDLGEPLLEVEDVRVRDDRDLEQVRGVDLRIREGEILGIAGVEGNGQMELIEAITGVRSLEAGRITVNDVDMTEMSRRQRIEAGVAYVPADRQADGLVKAYTLLKNALLGNQTIEPYVTRGVIDWGATRTLATEIIEKYDVIPQNSDADATALSGGNQQKFVVGRELEHDPALLVAAHPTRGVDIGSIEFIHNRLRAMSEQGMAILIVSSKLDEIQKIADRIAVMYNGTFIDIVDAAEVTEQDLGLMMAGQGRDEPEPSPDPETEQGAEL